MNYEKLISELQTPFYAFDLDILRKRIAFIKAALPERTELCYAVKANTFIIAEAEKSVSRLEVCSPGEFEICEALAVPMEKIVLSGVYKTPDFIESVISRYDTVGIYTIESVRQYELLKTLAEKYGRKINVLVRINAKSQFGVTEDDFDYIISDCTPEHMTIKGIQYFSTTQKSSQKKLKRELDYLTDFIQRAEEHYKITIEELEYGTGSPVIYFQEESFNEEEYLACLSQLISQLPEQLKVTLEMGRSIAASCGAYFSTVADTKTNKAGNFAVIDGGMNHLVYFGQSMAMKHPFFDIYPERNGTDTADWNICGSLCTVNDIVVKALPIADLAVNDTIIFKNTGAYCMCEGISLFLSRELPAVALVDNNETKLVREHFKTSELNKPNIFTKKGE